MESVASSPMPPPEDDGVIDLDPDQKPDPEPDPNVEALVEALEHHPPGPEHHLIRPFGLESLGSIIANLELRQQLAWMRQHLHIRPKGHAGRPKGSGLKESITVALELWIQGVPILEICRKLKIPRADKETLESGIRGRIRGLPKDERLAVRRARRENLERLRAVKKSR